MSSQLTQMILNATLVMLMLLVWFFVHQPSWLGAVLVVGCSVLAILIARTLCRLHRHRYRTIGKEIVEFWRGLGH